MKGIDIFCASQASTAICLAMDPASSSSSSSTSSIQLGGRAIDRHNPIIRDGRRSVGGARASLPNPPCSSQQPPINPKPYHQLQKTRKSSSKNKPSENQKKKSLIPKPVIDQKKKNVAKPEPAETEDVIVVNKNIAMASGESMRRSFVRQSDLFTPPGSTRYLLSDAPFFDGFSDHDPVLSLVPVEPKNSKNKSLSNITAQVQESQDESSVSRSRSSVSAQSKPPSDQVVVLRVSLHCKGCEGKVRKHLSRMKGVTSFNIDFAAKKVTVTGDVTPVSVLASISKVKSAQLWTPPSSAPPASVEIKK